MLFLYSYRDTNQFYNIKGIIGDNNDNSNSISNSNHDQIQIPQISSKSRRDSTESDIINSFKAESRKCSIFSNIDMPDLALKDSITFIDKSKFCSSNFFQDDFFPSEGNYW